MNIRALATDYDGTIARHGVVEESTVRALEAFRDSGRKLIMVTGRELPELLKIFPAAKAFDLLVAENGGLLYEPRTQRRQLLGPEPDARLIECLRERGVHPLSLGHTIIATQENYLGVIQDSVAELKLQLNLIPNKGALMILPAGVDKATGLRRAAAELGLSLKEIAGIGDAENDAVFLRECGCSAAVANGLQWLKERVDYVTQWNHGTGVEEFLAKVLSGTVPVQPSLFKEDILTTDKH